MMMGLGFAGIFLFWGGLFVLLVGGTALSYHLMASSRVPVQSASLTARRILDERLARGEISRVEYDVLLGRMGK